MRKISSILGVIILLLLSNCKNPKNNTINENERKLSPQTKDLYQLLEKASAKGFLIGHQDSLAYGINWRFEAFTSDIYKTSGEFPAVFGWDLGHIGDTNNIDGVPFERMKEWAIETNLRGGINTYSWHARNISSGGNSWDKTPCVSDILPDGPNHIEYCRKLDKIASFFDDLRDKKGERIPVIFRPWHEMNGSWFWWGKEHRTHDDYKTLWKFTVHYLTDHHKLDNILWCYSTDLFESSDEYLESYPGESYVDILGFDDYRGLRSLDSFPKTIRSFELLNRIATEKEKIYVLSETGSERIESPSWFTDVLYNVLLANESARGAAYVLFWRNATPAHFFVSYPGHPSVPNFREFVSHPESLTLDDLQDLRRVILKSRDVSRFDSP